MDENAKFGLDERQTREIEYHRDFARRNADKINQPVFLDILQDADRRWWNAYWCVYDALLALDLRRAKVFVPGCGFGDDAIRLALMGAEVQASDLSADVLEIARHRAERMGAASIHFDAMPAEALTYGDHVFDAVFYNDVLHHVDIPRALTEMRRVLKPGATVAINELYTNSAIQRIRDSAVARVLYPSMVKFIYGTSKPYITDDERKLNQDELATLESMLTDVKLDFFLMTAGRLFPARLAVLSRIDRALLKIGGRGVGRLLAGRFILIGKIT